MEIRNRSITLAAATATNLVCELEGQNNTFGVDCLGKEALGITMSNTGANPLTALTGYLTDDPAGVHWPTVVDIALPGGSLAAGAEIRFTIGQPGARRMKLVGTSASGTTILLNVNMGERS
jgi:hypothetical protein